MSYPTVAEISEMDKATPSMRLLWEWAWAFVEWFEGLDPDDEEVWLGTDDWKAVEEAFGRWWASR